MKIRNPPGLMLLLVSSCVAGSDGPRGPAEPSDPEPGLRPDLSAGAIEAPARISVDSMLAMRIGVRNGGALQAEPGWVVRVVLSRDRLIDSSDIEIDHFVAARVLPAGAQDQYLRHKKPTGRAPPGAYYVGSIMDVTGAIVESSEGNNTLRFPTPMVLTEGPETSEDR